MPTRKPGGIGTGKAGPGRPKGVPNKITKEVRDALREALESAHPDGAKGYFLEIAKTNPKVFMGAVQKLIPNVIEGELKAEAVLRVIDLSEK